MDTSIGPLVANFLSHKHKNALEISTNHNVGHNLKLVDSASINHIEKELQNKKMNKDEIENLSNCFKCQYMIRNEFNESIILVKKKQVFIIKLIEIKQFELGLRELSSLLQFLNKIMNNVPVNWNKCRDNVDIMEGLPFKELRVADVFQSMHTSEKAQIINLIISFHFLILQCLLQYTSINLNNFKGSKNPFLHYSIFKLVSEFFLLKNNFFRWLALAPEDLIHQKYKKNNEKMLNGYIKLINYLNKKGSHPDLNSYRSCLILKLLQITNDSKLIDHIQFNHRVLPFIDDLRISGSPNFELVSKRSPSFTTDKFLSDLSLFINKPSDEALNDLKMSILNTSKDFLNDSEFLELVSSFYLSKNPITLSFINLVSQYVNSSMNSKCLSNGYITILDSFISFIQDWGKECKDYATLSNTLMLLFDIFSRSKQVRGMKNVANAFYILGNNISRTDSWINSLECEIKIYEMDPVSNFFETYKKKLYKICNSLHHVDKSKESLDCLKYLIHYVDRELSGIVDFYDKIDSIQDTIFIRLLIKNLSSCINSTIYVFNGSNISDEFKVIILIRIFECLEKANNFNDRITFSNNLMKNLQVQDNNLKLIAYYHYYNLCYLSEFTDFEINKQIGSPLLLSGIFLLRAMHMNWEEDNMLRALEFIEKFLKEDKLPKVYDHEIEIFRNLINFLSFHDLNGYIIYIIKSYFMIRGETIKKYVKFYFHLQLELCTAVSKLQIAKSFSDNIISFNTAMKDLNYNSVRDVANFSLFQFEYCLLIGNNILAREKFTKILKLIQSREEFNVYSKITISMFERFQNLLIVCKFQLLASNLNFSLSNYEDSFSCTRIAIKLLYSIIKTLDNHKLNKADFNEIKWATIKLMFSSYRSMIRTLKQIGVTRDLLFYLQELTKLDASVSLPIVNSYNLHELIIHHYLLNRSLECERLLNNYGDIKMSKMIVQDLTLNYNYNEICKLHKMDTCELIPYCFNSLDEIPVTESLKKISLIKRTFAFDILYLRSLSIPMLPDNSTMYTTHDIYRKIIKIMMEVKLRLFGKDQLGVSNRSLSITYINLLRNSRSVDPDIIKINELLSFKDTLVNRILSCFKILSVYELADLSNLLNYCIMILSSIAVFKMNPTILKTLYYLQDLPKSFPLKYDKIINHGSINEILPPEISRTELEEDFNLLAGNFCDELKSHIPSKWSVITIDICNYTGDLLISKLSASGDPFFIRLDVNRYSNKDTDGQYQQLSFSEIIKAFKEIIAQSNISTKSSTTSNVITKTDRKNWWKARFSLDVSLKELLDKVSTCWFGGFKGIFNDSDSYLFDRFKDDFYDLLYNVLPCKENYPMSLDIDNNIISLFYNLEEFNEEEIEDIFLFLIESFENHGETEIEDIDTRKFSSLFKSIFEKYKLLKKNNQEHLILVPSAECAEFPWESLDFLRSKSISRVPSVNLLLDLLKNHYEQTTTSKQLQISKSKVYYLINPGGDLLRTEETFSCTFTKQVEWDGLIRTKPEESQLLHGLINSDLFVYLGHGGGEHYIRTSTLHKQCLPNGPPLPPSLLIGCSSGSLQMNGLLSPNGHIYNWLVCGSPMVLVNLWDVTDKDIDKFSSSVFEKWGLTTNPDTTMNLCEAVRSSRGCCTLDYLNGASPIVYGLPMYIRQ